jgi:large subunit ribosomal protein L30
MVYAVVRVRGTINTNPDIKRTLRLLSLTRINHCVLLEENPSTKGMLQTTKDYVTWGEIDKDALSKLIKTRGKLEGDKELTDDYIKSSTSYENIEKLSKAIIDNKFRYKEIPSIKPIFRLSPPKKGYEGIKRSFVNDGALGYRGKEINKLIEKML